MAQIRITGAPPCPDGVSLSDWNAEWIGLEVHEASEYTTNIGYLGQSRYIWDDSIKQYRTPTSSENMDQLTVSLNKDVWWFLEAVLTRSCKQAVPLRRLILDWLKQPAQLGRSMFVIPKYQAEHLT